MVKDKSPGIFHDEEQKQPSGPVECLGMIFPNDEERRKHFLEILKEKLKDTEFRKIEGFPIGEDEDILALSDPPYYTACPNPFIEEFIRLNGKPYDPDVPYSREPFAADVSEGKNDPIYNVHSYHTKVPYKAIMRYILHYTEPGDIVLDGFCGTGMTGIAAQSCHSKDIIQELGYQIDPDNKVLSPDIAPQEKISWRPLSKTGGRYALLVDLGPAATMIAYNYAVPVPILDFQRHAKRILSEISSECRWMLETKHSENGKSGVINYVVWSESHLCTECSAAIVFFDNAIDHKASKVLDTFLCPECKAQLKKDDLVPYYETIWDPNIGENIKIPKRTPVLINYTVERKRFEKRPDNYDLELLKKIVAMPLPQSVPLTEIPDMQMMRVGRMQPVNIHRIHQFYLQRTLQIVGRLWEKVSVVDDSRIRALLIFWIESQLVNLSLRNRYRPDVSFPYNPLTGVFYVPPMMSEGSPLVAYENKLMRILKAFESFDPLRMSLISTNSATDLSIPPNSVDYIFTDPPFGENIYYSDLNYFIEAWLHVFSNTKTEAIVDRVKIKTLSDYQELMSKCFREYYRVLKPGRWMTVEFHNSKNSVWNAIQEAIQRAGFVIADVRTLDKQQKSFQQVVSGGAVKQDLIITAYKPNGGLETRFQLEAGTEEGVWDFINTHLNQLPVFVSKKGQAEIIAERQNYLLFDRMVAFHVQRGVTVPMSAAEFYAALIQRYFERDGMFFLPEQAAEYDKKRLTVKEVLQLQLFVTDEASAIQWLRQQLLIKTQTAGELKPQFMQEISAWQKNEKMLELDELLSENFLIYDGTGDVPNQIHSYLSTNFKELRNLKKDDPLLRAKGKDRWYVPDPNKAGDLEKIREKALLREFWEYLPPGYKPLKGPEIQQSLPGFKDNKIPSGKKLKIIRLEAVRVGFKYCWQNKDYKTIIAVAQRIPQNVLEEDPKLLMWYDQALTRMGTE